MSVAKLRSGRSRGSRYQAVKRVVLERIAAGRYSVTQAVPSDKVLSAELGVSPMTVWRALQELVMEGVLARQPGRGRGTFVREAAPPGGTLRAGIGLQRLGVLYGPDPHPLQASPVHFLTFLEIQTACARRGVSIEFLPAQADWSASQIEQAASAHQRQALIVLRWSDSDSLVAVQRSGLPVIVASPGLDHTDLSFVAPNDSQGAFIVTRYLLSLGHRRIGIVNARVPTRSGADRQVGWRLALAAEAGQPGRPAAIDDAAHPFYPVEHEDESDFDRLRFALAAQFRTRRPPTALFVRDGFLAYATILALREVGLKYPADVSVGCVGGFYEQVLEMPRMTTAAPAEGALGRSVLQLAEDLLAGRQDGPVGLMLPMQLVEGATAQPVDGAKA